MLLAPLPVLTCLGVTLHFICVSLPGLRHAVVSIGVILAGWIGWRKLTGALQKHDLYLGLVYGAACLAVSPGTGQAIAGPDSMRFGLIVSWVMSSLIARQVAAWILAGPTVDHERMKRWRVNLPQVIPHGLSLDCPELLTYTVSPATALGVVVCLALAADPDRRRHLVLAHHVCSSVVQADLAHLASLWRFFSFRFPSPDESLKATWRAIVVFITYDIYHTPAAGVFRFPTRWLRSPWSRWAVLAATLVAIGFGYGIQCPSPIAVLQTGGSFLMQLLANLVLISLTGPLVLLGNALADGGNAAGSLREGAFSASGRDDHGLGQLRGPDRQLQRRAGTRALVHRHE